MTKAALKAPGLPGSRIRTGWRLLTNSDLLSELSVFDTQQTDLISWRVVQQRFFATRSPDHVEHVLIGGHEKYIKSVHYRLIAAVTGDGLLTSEGEPWTRNRRLIQPIFAKGHLDDLAPHMTAATADFLGRWNGNGRAEVIDVAEAMSEVTLDVVGRALFGATLSDAADRLRPAVVIGLRTGVAAARLQLLLAVPRRLVDLGGRLLFRVPVPPPLRKIRAAMHTIDDVVHEVIDQRQAAPPTGGDDLLALLLAARDEHGDAFSRKEVRDEAVTLILAGHETTANGLAWMWFLLSQHPAARERLEAEVDDVLGGRIPTGADVDRLPFTTACFMEALRLYPPAWVLEREAAVDDDLDGYRIPAKATVIMLVHLIHRDPRWWDDPDAFVPERFLEGAPPPRRGTYLPFGAGRRVCVGAAFATMEAVLIAAMISQRFTLDLRPGADVTAEATVTLRPRHGLPMTVRAR